MKPICIVGAFLAAKVQATTLFIGTTEQGGEGSVGRWAIDTGMCLSFDGIFDKNISWADAEGGFVSGCFLYDERDCKGENVMVEARVANMPANSPINLTELEFDNRARSVECHA
ncbi:hypothetical protein DM02DRAFT_665726 [Periconia macrospinosa]|uniref:Uncharacterized protein n=1 Tax=Periconia macrospinosa TaxID=97972 RepID=A0A2V1EFU7_9PLEO|nr:hypothetical protein DM02DRAFT_665726 [Periconia macrospinosa]